LMCRATRLMRGQASLPASRVKGGGVTARGKERARLAVLLCSLAGRLAGFPACWPILWLHGVCPSGHTCRVQLSPPIPAGPPGTSTNPLKQVLDAVGETVDCTTYKQARPASQAHECFQPAYPHALLLPCRRLCLAACAVWQRLTHEAIAKAAAAAACHLPPQHLRSAMAAPAVGGVYPAGIIRVHL
jgi:hypothetical protein